MFDNIAIIKDDEYSALRNNPEFYRVEQVVSYSKGFVCPYCGIVGKLHISIPNECPSCGATQLAELVGIMSETAYFLDE